MDDGDDEPWTRSNPRTGVEEILRADRFHRPDPNLNDTEDAAQACMGIRVNIWNRAKVRRLLTHSLVGGGTHQLGYDALDISEPVCKYCVSIFVKYNLIYFDVSVQKYVQILTQILANRYAIHQCIYWILTCKYQILTSKYHILKSSI